MRKEITNRFGFSNFSFVFSFIWVISLILLGAINGLAQNARNTSYSPDKTLKSNARINPSTHAVELSIPISGYQGRAGNGLPVTFDYSSKVWEITPSSMSWTTPLGTHMQDAYPKYAMRTAGGWTSNLTPPRIDYKFDAYEGNYQGIGDNGGYEGQIWTMPTMPDPEAEAHDLFYIKRLHVQMPDGSTHEFRQNDAINFCGYTTNGGCSSFDFNGTYYSVDGSKMRLEVGTSASTLYLPDGSRYLFGQNSGYIGHLANAFVDRNGNKMTFNSTNRQWTDTMGRVITDPMPYNWSSTPNQTVGDTTASFPGFNGSSMNVTMSWRYLKDPNNGESGLNNPSLTLGFLSNIYCNGSASSIINDVYLFGGGGSGVRVCSLVTQASNQRFNPIVLTKITLPNGQSYQFKYNIYGEIEKITYPSGGYERFVYAQIKPVQGTSPQSYDQANRGVSARYISPSGSGNDEIQWSYSAPASIPVNNNPYTVTTTAPDGTRTEQVLWSEDGAQSPYGYGALRSGMPMEERVYSSTNQLMKRTLTSYIETTGTTGQSNNIPATRDLRPSKQVSITFEPGAASALAAMSETIYDSNADVAYFAPMNPKQQKSYHYISLGLSTAQTATIDTIAAMFGTGQLANTSETDFIYDANYKARNITGLASAARVKDPAGNIVSQSQIYYDEGSYPIISQGSTTGWEDPGTNYRGNPTTVASWLNTNNSWIATHSQYDNFGNVLKTWDARGNLSEMEYASGYYFAYPTKTKSPIPDPSGNNGSASLFETNMTYDLVSGLLSTATDANGQVTQMQYNDSMLRLTRVIPPNGGAISEMVYNDTPGNIWVKTRSQIDGTNWKEAITYADNLGRIVKTQSIDAQGDVFSETVYDNMGRAYLSSNPYRAGETKYWTQTNFDVAGRAKETVTPDGAKVTIDYGQSLSGKIGTLRTITDQAGRKRSGIVDALGRMIRVIEDPNGQNLATDYVFDTMGNLHQTIQGEQNRYFLYDSLGRLLRAKQPEQDATSTLAMSDPITGNSAWSVGYTYDNAGNITSTMDARGVTITGTYDNFNRLVTRDYSDTTPDAFFKYDGAGANIPYSKGKTTEVNTVSGGVTVSSSKYTSFDNFGRIKSSQQITDGQTYNFADYSYNLAGQLVSQTYPSGRTVSNQYGTDGALTQVNGTFQGNNKTYTGNISYTSAGAVAAMQLGNGRWETAQFNTRLQVTQIGLGTASNNQDILKLNYDYGSTDNNGAMKSQQITVTGQFTAYQTYDYDSFNRLQSSQEVINNQQTWKQTFQYDRYGNRKFDANQTTTLGGCPTNVCNPDISTSTNRVTGSSYDQAGNVTQDAENRLFFYDAENRQKEVRNASNQVVGQYIYDGEGHRVQKLATQENTIFVYDAFGKMTSEYTVSASNSQTPQTSYLTEDNLGSPRVITDQSGNVVSRHDYMAFGEEIARANYGADSNRDKYTGYERDVESNLDYAQARYYNSRNGRFTSVDPLTASATVRNPQTFNRYSYGLNSPYKFTDPLGLSASDSNDTPIAFGSDGYEKQFNKIINGKNAKALLQFHIENQTALGMWILNHQDQSQQTQQQGNAPEQNNQQTQEIAPDKGYFIRYDIGKEVDFEGETPVSGSQGGVPNQPLYGSVRNNRIWVYKDGELVTSSNVTIEEQVTNISVTITVGGKRTKATPEIINELKSGSLDTNNQRNPVYDKKTGLRPIDRQGLFARDSDDYNLYKLIKLTSVDKVRFIVREGDKIVATRTIISTKTVNSVVIRVGPNRQF
ncbi:MAG TPA: RHS repeat-associated core domain-containing protein [Pyrinomonadaceae bacterium]|nr:RHS repeat-associated core domain-containing protein [Pyrinomonadaceae bacterium]